MQIVEEIGRFAIAFEHALDGNLRVRRPGPGCLAKTVVKDQFDAGTADRLAVSGTIENHVLHVFAAQLLGRGFAKHPTDGVDYVRFAATIRADDPDQLARHRDVCGINERLETSELDVGESQFVQLYKGL